MNSSSPYISVVSPVYNGELLLEELVSRLMTNLKNITDDFEIILVEDGGPDNSWDKILEHSKKDARIKGIKLSKNFGQHHAISAGLDASAGEWVVVMDCDLQDRPEEIVRLHEAATRNDFHIVLAQRALRRDPFFKTVFSKLFYSILSFLTGTKHDSSIANFGIYHRKVIEAIKTMHETIRYFPVMINWVGFRTTKIAVDHGERPIGSSSYNFKRLLNLAFDIILANSDKPLRLTIKIGLLISTIAFGFAIHNVIKALQGEIEVLGYASIIISIWLLGGFIIIILGVIGLYVGKTFEGVKNRPNYIVESFTWER